MLGVATRIRRALVGVLWSGGAQVQVAMGIHCGPLIAGVAGRTLLRYRLFGDSVNTCARIKGLAVRLAARASGDEAERDKAVPGAEPFTSESVCDRAESSGGSHMSSGVTGHSTREGGSSILLSDAAVVALIRGAQSHRLFSKRTPHRRNDAAVAYLDSDSSANMLPNSVHRSDMGADAGAPTRPLDSGPPESSRQPTGVGAADNHGETSTASDTKTQRPSTESRFNGKQPSRDAILEVTLSESCAAIRAVSPAQVRDKQMERRREKALEALQDVSTRSADVSSRSAGASLLRADPPCGHILYTEAPTPTRSTVQLRNLGKFALKGKGRMRVWKFVPFAEDGSECHQSSSRCVCVCVCVCESMHIHPKPELLAGSSSYVQHIYIRTLPRAHMTRLFPLTLSSEGAHSAVREHIQRTLSVVREHILSLWRRGSASFRGVHGAAETRVFPYS